MPKVNHFVLQIMATVAEQRWSRDLGPVVKVGRLKRKTIQDEEAKEPFCGFQGASSG